MAQRKPAAVPSKKATPAAKRAAPTTTSSTAARPPSRPPTKKPGKSIVNQKQTPWGLIITTVVLVLFAAAIVTYAIVSHKDSSSSASSTTTGGQKVSGADPYRQPELPAAKAINGITYTVEGEHNHVQGTIAYDHTPPIGGNHSQYWADCAGTVYDQPIANENAVHMLEHGAVWITYNAKTLPADQLATLKKLVDGQDRMALSPYPNLKTPISLQSWGYQLFVQKATDARIQRFISLLRYNKHVTPEFGATCSDPSFKTHPSTFGHPLSAPTA